MMKKTTITELIPSSSRKSFNRRAFVIESNGSHFLRSYSTIVCSVDGDGKVHRYWPGRTQTTSMHIKSFLTQFSDIGTDEYKTLPIEKTPTVTVSL